MSPILFHIFPATLEKNPQSAVDVLVGVIDPLLMLVIKKYLRLLYTYIEKYKTRLRMREPRVSTGQERLLSLAATKTCRCIAALEYDHSKESFSEQILHL